MIEKSSRLYRITGIKPVLGSLPASRAVREQYIASKAPSPEKIADEMEAFSGDDDRGVTVFTRNSRMNDCLCLRGYQICGLIKEALEALQAQTGVLQPRGKVDRYLFCEPDYIPLMRDGKKIYDEDEMNERPLRAMGMMGPRVTLASSEQVNEPWYVDIELTLIPNKGTAKSKPITWDEVETALEYGAYKGLCQWRNAGYGMFVYERLDKDEENE